ncbi:MAG: M20/M25/M40 family metallo-hydrolase [Erysipelotrichaceae bacterium]|nr:M20/M25/M40 family metallo-hydrolase [Erysipelotrichaceae bacterium]
MNINKIIELRKLLHQYPEIANNEVKTQQIIRNFLTENTNVKVINEDGWLYAKMEGLNPKKTIVFRADHDAIVNSKNQLFHGCGHDGHTAILCGTIMQLEEDRPDDNIIFLFQPAEENADGAKKCTKLFQDYHIDEIYGLHNMPNFEKGIVYYRKGCIQCASVGMRISIDGIQSHASEPEKGLNPAYAIAEVIERLKPLSAFNGFNKAIFEDLIFESLVLVTVVNVEIGKRNFGISPGSGEISLTLRTMNDQDMKMIKTKIMAMLNKFKEVGYSYKIDLYDEFPENNNNPILCDQTLKILDKYHIEYREMFEPFRASEDFGYYRRFCPSLFLMLGMGTCPSLHHDDYQFDDDIIKAGIKLFSSIAKG